MKIVFKIFLIFGIIAGMAVISLLLLTGVGYYKLSHERSQMTQTSAGDINNKDITYKELESENAKLVEKIKKVSPKGTYIVVDTAKNRLYLKKDAETVRKAVVATGNGNILSEKAGKKRSWTFDTPRGEFAVKTKLKEPVWVKPDWAFIEEGEDVPKTLADRIQEDVMGEYAMGFGNGFFIHGTIYTRLLGRNATHGCVRVGDDDLLAVNEASSVGTKIYIY
jgi:L,D-transpeptidase ErfK/SrfK